MLPDEVSMSTWETIKAICEAYLEAENQAAVKEFERIINAQQATE